MSLPISRSACANMYRPTPGDRVRFKPGGNGLINGQLDDAGKKQQALSKFDE